MSIFGLVGVIIMDKLAGVKGCRPAPHMYSSSAKNDTYQVSGSEVTDSPFIITAHHNYKRV